MIAIGIEMKIRFARFQILKPPCAPISHSVIGMTADAETMCECGLNPKLACADLNRSIRHLSKEHEQPVILIRNSIRISSLNLKIFVTFHHFRDLVA